jgi:hypothetical protein
MTKHTEIDAGRHPGPWARSLFYNRESDEIRLLMESGVTVVIPRSAIPELRNVPASHMADLRLLGDGELIESKEDDVHILVPGLLWDLIGFDEPVPCWSETDPQRNGRASAQASR